MFRFVTRKRTPASPSPSPKAPATYLLPISKDLPTSGTSCTWNRTARGLLSPASSTRHSVLGVRPHCGTYQQFIPRYRCFLYPPARRWTFGVLPLGAFSERCHEELIPVRVFGFSCGCLLSISRGRGIARALGDSALSLLGTRDSVSQRGRPVSSSPPATHEGSGPSTSLQTLVVIGLFDTAVPVGAKWDLAAVWSLVSLIACDVEHLL